MKLYNSVNHKRGTNVAYQFNTKTNLVDSLNSMTNEMSTNGKTVILNDKKGKNSRNAMNTPNKTAQILP